MDDNYTRIVDKLSEKTGLEKDEIEKRVEEKRAKLSGLISKEGAVQVIAAELGVNFDNMRSKIEDLLPTMRKVNVVGKIVSLSPVRTFMRDGKENKVMDFRLADDTSNVKVVLWDTNHISLFEKEEIGTDSIVELGNGNVRDNEIHLGSFSELNLSDENFEDVKSEIIVKEKNIVDFVVSESVSVRAFVVQSFEPRFFEVCPQCGKKPTAESDGAVCQQHGKVTPERRGILNVILDDGTESIRAVFFGDLINDLGFTDLGNSDLVQSERDGILGKEMIFSGDVRNNKFFNNMEIIVDKVEEVNMDGLLQELENAD